MTLPWSLGVFKGSWHIRFILSRFLPFWGELIFLGTQNSCSIPHYWNFPQMYFSLAWMVTGPPWLKDIQFKRVWGLWFLGSTTWRIIRSQVEVWSLPQGSKASVHSWEGPVPLLSNVHDSCWIDGAGCATHGGLCGFSYVVSWASINDTKLEGENWAHSWDFLSDLQFLYQWGSQITASQCHCEI